MVATVARAMTATSLPPGVCVMCGLMVSKPELCIDGASAVWLAVPSDGVLHKACWPPVPPAEDVPWAERITRPSRSRRKRA